MDAYESFGRCLQRLLEQEGLSVSAAARLVGMRSRNSLFRILSDETGAEVDARFLATLRRALADVWPQSHWRALETALEIKRVGLRRYEESRAFLHGMCGGDAQRQYTVECMTGEGTQERPLQAVLREMCSEGSITVLISGCCERGLASLFASCFSEAAMQGRLTVRHYIDSDPGILTRHLLSVIPLMSKVWYNARLVDDTNCPEELAAIYRVNSVCVIARMEDGSTRRHCLLQCDRDRFVASPGGDILIRMLERNRFQLALLKPMAGASGGPEAFVEYTQQYAQLENDCMILSVKPDVHFNLVPTGLLYPAILEGFARAGIAAGEELTGLLTALQQIHDARVANMCSKRRPTHIVYSLQAMEQFMRTGVQSDHFFLQRAYTPEERREIIRLLIRQMQEDPYFHVYFLRPELPEIRSEMTFYEGKGVLIMDAYTSYDLHDDHSEALISQPGFQSSFQRFFMDVLLGQLVLSRQESLAQLERLAQM